MVSVPPAAALSPPPVGDLLPDPPAANAALLDTPDVPASEPPVSGAADSPPLADTASPEALQLMDCELPPPVDPGMCFEGLLECEPADPLTFDLQSLNLDSQEPPRLPEPPDLHAPPGPGATEGGQGLQRTPEPPPVPQHGSTAAGGRCTGASEAAPPPEEAGLPPEEASPPPEEAGPAGHAALANWMESQPR